MSEQADDLRQTGAVPTGSLHLPADDAPDLANPRQDAGVEVSRSSDTTVAATNTPASTSAFPPLQPLRYKRTKRGDRVATYTDEEREIRRKRVAEARKAKTTIEKATVYDERIGRKDLTNCVNPDAFEGVELLADVRYEDIARRFWLGQSFAEIAAAHNMSDRRLRAITREPGMIAAFLRVKAEILSNIDKTLFDEKAAPLVRARAGAIRAQTLLAEVIEEVRARIADGGPSAQMLKVGVEAAVATIDRSGTELARAMNRGGVDRGVNVNVNVGNFRDGTGALLQGTITESGVDLTDIMRARRVPNDDTPQPEAP